MAHDRQLAENNSERSAAREQLKRLSGTVADWLMLYAQTYREEITPEMALLYQEALSDIKPEVLHQAFLVATRICKFRPMPAEVRDAAQAIMARNRVGNRPTYLDEPQLSESERNAELESAEYQALRRRVIGR